jgi:hypothetical protein
MPERMNNSGAKHFLADVQPLLNADRPQVVFDLSQVQEGQLTFTVRYTIRATNHKRNLVYPFYVIPDEEEAE